MTNDVITLDGIKRKYVGKKLLTIIDIELTDLNKIILRKITDSSDSYDIDEAKILLFEDNNALVFTDFDCDGYRSGSWFLNDIEEILDKGSTKGIKNINSEVLDIEYFDRDDIEHVLITTKEYLIDMGQNSTDSYYPYNFFDVKEAKQFVMGKNAKRVVFDNGER